MSPELEPNAYSRDYGYLNGNYGTRIKLLLSIKPHFMLRIGLFLLMQHDSSAKPMIYLSPFAKVDRSQNLVKIKKTNEGTLESTAFVSILIILRHRFSSFSS